MVTAEAGSGFGNIPPDYSSQNGHADRGKDRGILDLAICADGGDFVSSNTRTQQHSNILDLAVCGDGGDVPSMSKRRRAEKQDGLLEVLRKAMVDHQLGLSLNLLALLALTHVMFPSLRKTTSAFFALSYPTQQDGMYGLGSRDMYLVSFLVVLFTAVRAGTLDYVLIPLAEACGVKTRKAKIRFAEQSYLLLYYLVYWPLGVYLFVEDTPSSVDSMNSLLISLWRDFPRLYIAAPMKLYYLSQFAFWIQQLAVIHLEERRKDHFQMLAHHVITSALLFGSYGYRQLRAGNAVLIIMDAVDVIFSSAKILRYLKLQAACDAAFALFVFLWLFARHICYLTVCWSIYQHVNNDAMPYGTFSLTGVSGQRLSPDGGNKIAENLFQPFTRPESATVAFNANVRWTFLGLLLALQVITILWFVMILRVAWNVIRGYGADDSRSDGEDEAEDEETPAPKPKSGSVAYRTHDSEEQATAGVEKPRYIEVDGSSEDPNFVGSRTGSKSKRVSKASGVSLAAHKDVLNRIGCLSDEQLARERERKGSMSPRPGSASGP